MWWLLTLLACNEGKDDDGTVPADADTDADADADADSDADVDTTDTSSPDAFHDPVLWQPVPLDLAADLGHTPSMEPSPVDAGGLMFQEVGVAAGLGGSVSGAIPTASASPSST